MGATLYPTGRISRRRLCNDVLPGVGPGTKENVEMNVEKPPARMVYLKESIVTDRQI